MKFVELLISSMRRDETPTKLVGKMLAAIFALVLFGLTLPNFAHAQRNLVVSDVASPRDRINMGGSEKRVALVIGNNDYKESKLTASINDARAMAKALRELNFEVVQLEDVGRLAMLRAIRKFSDDLSRSGTVGLFYFAGHGVQSKGKNFLVPVDAEIDHEDEIDFQSIDIQDLLDRLQEVRGGMTILVLDACRNNPFARSNVKRPSGLAAVDAPPGTLVAFAARPGQVANETKNGNGIYTRNILENIRTPGLPIEEVFKRIRAGVIRDTNNKQEPSEYTSLVRDFYFTAAPTGQGYRSPIVDSEADAWAQIEGSKNIYDLIGFLRRFPDTRFTQALLNRVNEILGKIKPAPPAILANELPGLLHEATAGFEIRELNRYSAEFFGLTTAKGVLVNSVDRGSVAQRAGLLPGDIILRVNGVPIEGIKDAAALSRKILPGEYAEAVIWRNRKKITASVIAQRAPIERSLSEIAAIHLQNKDYERARIFYEYLANVDDSRGQALLGIFYFRGLGGPRDLRLAESWLSKAAQQGHALAAAILSEIYLTPDSGIKNDTEAFRLAKSSAEAGMPEGAAMLALAYLRGVGTPREPLETVKWSRFAAEQGNPAGMFLLGLAYENGAGGLSKNLEDAKIWLRRSRDLNFSPARVALQRLGE